MTTLTPITRSALYNDMLCLLFPRDMTFAIMPYLDTINFTPIVSVLTRADGFIRLQNGNICTYGKEICIWDTDLKLVKKISVTGSVQDLIQLDDGDIFYCNHDGEVVLWDPNMNTIDTWISDEVYQLFQSESGNIALWYEDGEIYICNKSFEQIDVSHEEIDWWKASDYSKLYRCMQSWNASPPLCLRNKTAIIIGKVTKLVDAKSNTLKTFTTNVPDDDVHNCVQLKNGDHIGFSSYNRVRDHESIAVFDMKMDRVVNQLTIQDDLIRVMYQLNDGRLLYANDASLSMWNYYSNNTMTKSAPNVNGLGQLADGRIIVCTTTCIAIWN